MNTDRLKHKETTDIILKSFYEVYNEQLVPLTLHMRLINQLLEDPPALPQGEAGGGQETNIEVGLLLNFGYLLNKSEEPPHSNPLPPGERGLID
jgi:hypothetical protein